MAINKELLDNLKTENKNFVKFINDLKLKPNKNEQLENILEKIKQVKHSLNFGKETYAGLISKIKHTKKETKFYEDKNKERQQIIENIDQLETILDEKKKLYEELKKKKDDYNILGNDKKAQEIHQNIENIKKEIIQEKIFINEKGLQKNITKTLNFIDDAEKNRNDIIDTKNLINKNEQNNNETNISNNNEEVKLKKNGKPLKNNGNSDVAFLFSRKENTNKYISNTNNNGLNEVVIDDLSQLDIENDNVDNINSVEKSEIKNINNIENLSYFILGDTKMIRSIKNEELSRTELNKNFRVESSTRRKPFGDFNFS